VLAIVFTQGLDDEVDRLIQAGETLAQQSYNESLFRRTDLPSLSYGSMGTDEQVGSHSGFADDLMPNDDVRYLFNTDYGSRNEYDDEDDLDDLVRNNSGKPRNC
jgi:hypothetical protein